jgi:hypothetical protein
MKIKLNLIQITQLTWAGNRRRAASALVTSGTF